MNPIQRKNLAHQCSKQFPTLLRNPGAHYFVVWSECGEWVYPHAIRTRDGLLADYIENKIHECENSLTDLGSFAEAEVSRAYGFKTFREAKEFIHREMTSMMLELKSTKRYFSRLQKRDLERKEKSE